MDEPQKPFACNLPECGMSFTNEDHLHVHTKKHDMCLQFGTEQAGKAGFVADQTPTPTRFIRNCEEVGLFQDLQNVTVNPFDEGFKRAMETKPGILTMESTMSDDVLHTPQMVFPLIDTTDSTLFSSNQRNITISRSSSDESGTIKEYERATISKLTTISSIIENRDEKTDVTKNTDSQKDVYRNNIVKQSNVTKDGVNIDKTVPILVYTDSTKNIHINKDVLDNHKLLPPDKIPIMSQKSLDFVVDSLTNELTTPIPVKEININKTYNRRVNIKVNDQTTKKGINSRSICYITRKRMTKPIKEMNKIESKPGEFEVLIKLPDGKFVRMKPVEETAKPDTKVLLRNTLKKKHEAKKPPATNILQIPGGTLIPVTLVDQKGAPISNKDLSKMPITKVNQIDTANNLTKIPITVTKSDTATTKLSIPTKVLPTTKPVTKLVNFTPIDVPIPMLTPIEPNRLNAVPKITSIETMNTKNNFPPIQVSQPYQIDKETGKRKNAELVYLNTVNKVINDRDNERDNERDNDDCVIEEVSNNPEAVKRTRFELESRCAASKRYRGRLKEVMSHQATENRMLREANQRLIAEKAVLKLLITEHMKRCPNADDLRSMRERMNM